MDHVEAVKLDFASHRAKRCLNKIERNEDKTMRFVKLRGDYYALDEIRSVRKLNKPSKGHDGVERTRVVRVTEAAMGTEESKYCSIWLSEDEAEELLKLIEQESAEV